MKDRVSELMDGELDDRSAAATIRALGGGGEALEAWRTYHLISDAMRDTRVLSEGFTARLARRLHDEPTVLAGRLQAQGRQWFAMSAAASLAAVGLVGWLAFAPQRGNEPASSPLAQAPASAPALEAKLPPRVPLPSATNDYLLAHQGYSPRVSLQGMAPYVRTVSEHAQEGRK